MFPHREFAQYCIREIVSHNTGFVLSGGELLLRDKENELTIYTVIARKRNKAILSSNAISAYKRSCELVFQFLSLPTQIPDTLNAVMYEDMWPEYKESPVLFKRLAPESGDETVEVKRLKEDTIKIEQKYRFNVDADRLALFHTTDRSLVEKFIVNIQKYAVVAWGMVEQLLEGTRNPFRLIPLFTYGCTAAEWLNSVLAGMDVSSIASSIGQYEECVFEEVLYRDNEKKFVVAKRVGETPLVFLNDPKRERPVKDCPEPFMAALFFYIYAGGTKGNMRMIDESYLKFCLREPVVRPLICEKNKQLAASRYKRVLADITDGRTQQEILSQFETVEDLATHLIVDPVDLKFDIITVYVHPENQRVIKLANRVCRWTNLTIHPPAQYYVKDAQIRQALILSSGEVEMEAIKALADEADFSIFQTLFMFSDCTVSFVDDELKNAFSDEWDNLVRNGRLNVKFLKDITAQLELKKRCPDYVQINSGIAYGAGKFYAVNDKHSSLLKSLNEDKHLQLLQTKDAPLVSNLFTVDLELAPYLITASSGKLALPLRQAETLQKKVDVLLQPILRDAFTTGPWKRLTVGCNIAATLQSAFRNKDTHWISFQQFWEYEENLKKSSSLVPFYVVQNTDQSLFIHYSKHQSCVVFETKDDVVNRRDDLTSYCKDYNGVQLLNTPLTKDGNFIVFMLHLIFTMRTKHGFRYDDLLHFSKQNMLFLASLYNVSLTEAENFAVFDHTKGENLLTHFLEKTFFSHANTYAFLTAVNAVAVMKEYASENSIEAISTREGTLFVTNLTIPILYTYYGVHAKEMYSTLFDLWLASERGNVGFLNLSIENMSEVDMETDIDSPHYLTLVYTPDLLNVPLPQPFKHYGKGVIISQQEKQHLSNTHRQLTKWAVDIDLTGEHVSEVISSHTMTLLRYKSVTSVKRFSINYFDQTTLNNTLSIYNENIMRKIKPKKGNYYASLQITDQEFISLFGQKMIR